MAEPAARHRSGAAGALQPGWEGALLLWLQRQPEGTWEIPKSSIFHSLGRMPQPAGMEIPHSGIVCGMMRTQVLSCSYLMGNLETSSVLIN